MAEQAPTNETIQVASLDSTSGRTITGPHHYACLMFAQSDGIRLLRLPRPVVDQVRAEIIGSWPKGIQVHIMPSSDSSHQSNAFFSEREWLFRFYPV